MKGLLAEGAGSLRVASGLQAPHDHSVVHGHQHGHQHGAGGVA
jgi:hypothetical protein